MTCRNGRVTAQLDTLKDFGVGEIQARRLLLSLSQKFRGAMLYSHLIVSSTQYTGERGKTNHGHVVRSTTLRRSGALERATRVCVTWDKLWRKQLVAAQEFVPYKQSVQCFTTTGSTGPPQGTTWLAVLIEELTVQVLVDTSKQSIKDLPQYRTHLQHFTSGICLRFTNIELTYSD